MLRVVLLVAWLPLASQATAVRCCEDAKCYDRSWPWDDVPLPDCPEDFQPAFYLNTRANRVHPQMVDRTRVPSNFDKDLETVIIVHGYQADHTSDWVETIKEALLDKDDLNVIRAGWGNASHDLNYLKVVSNCRVVSRELHLVVDSLVTNGGASREKIWCIGHSVGGHVCGLAGKRATLGRITGLDPAGPGFFTRDPSAGLEKTDASFVDVIHTNSRGIYTFGLHRSLGHMDFFPNEAKLQPGCKSYYEGDIELDVVPRAEDVGQIVALDIDGTLSYSVRKDPVKCSHSRSYYYFTESITQRCFLARHGGCTNIKKLPESCQECATPCAVMGYDARGSGADGNYYLKTSDTEPFCLS